jgi:hypothetical protein
MRGGSDALLPPAAPSADLGADGHEAVEAQALRTAAVSGTDAVSSGTTAMTHGPANGRRSGRGRRPKEWSLAKARALLLQEFCDA